MTTETIAKGEIVTAEEGAVSRIPRDATPMALIKAALKGGADVATMTGLLALQERWEANEARKAFVVAMANFKAEQPTILKNKHVGFKSKNGGAGTDFDHATLDNVCDTINPILSKHGLSYRWKTAQADSGMVTVTCIVTHVLGHSEETALRAMPDSSGSKNPIQAVGSTVTSLERYTVLSAFGLATVDMMDADSGGDPHSMFVTTEQIAEIQDALDEAKADAAPLCKWLGINSLAELQAVHFKKAMDAIAARKKAVK